VSVKFPRYVIPLFVVYLADSVAGVERLREAVLCVQSSVPELGDYFEKLYTADDPSVSRSELYDDIQILLMRKYIDIYGNIHEQDKALFTTTSRGRLYVENNVIPLIRVDVYAEIRRTVRTCLGLEERGGGSASGDRPVGELLRGMGLREDGLTLTLAQISSYVESRLDNLMTEYAEKLAEAIRYCRSAYCVATKIDGVYSFFKFLDEELRLGLNLGEVLEKILGHADVVRAAAKIPDIESLPRLVSSDVKFRALQPVSSVIASWASRVAEKQQKEEQQKAYVETARRMKRGSYSAPMKRRLKTLALILTALTLAALLLYLAYIIQRFTGVSSQQPTPTASTMITTPIRSTPATTSPYIRLMETVSTPTSTQRGVQTSTTLQQHQTPNQLATSIYTQTTSVISSSIWSTLDRSRF